MFEKFELDDYMNHVDAGYAANFAEALSRIQAGESALYCTWGPSAWLLSLVPGEDVKWINVPGIVEDETERAEGVPGAVTDPIDMGYVAADIQVAANNDFLEANPAAAELFRQVSLPIGWVSEVDAKMDEQDLSDPMVRPLAQELIVANHETVDGWLAAARAAAQ